MGPLPSSFGNEYILVVVDYVSKWVEATTCQKNDAKTVIKFLKRLLLDLEFQEFSLVMKGHIFAMLNWQRFFL